MIYKINKKRLVLIVFLMLLEITFVSLAIRSFGNKETSKYVMMKQDDTGKYLEITDTTEWPTDGYVLNLENSNCINTDGKKVNNALDYDKTTKEVIVNISTSLSCYFYFDKETS